MNETQIKEKLSTLSDSGLVELLLGYGHELTVQARAAYEFQGPGVDDPRLLRDCNEIQHRVLQAIKEVTGGSGKRFSLSGISHWILAKENNNTIQQASMQAFTRACARCNT